MLFYFMVGLGILGFRCLVFRWVMVVLVFC